MQNDLQIVQKYVVCVVFITLIFTLNQRILIEKHIYIYGLWSYIIFEPVEINSSTLLKASAHFYAHMQTSHSYIQFTIYLRWFLVAYLSWTASETEGHHHIN